MKLPGLNGLDLLWSMAVSVIADSLFVWPLHVVQAAGQNAEIALFLGVLWGGMTAMLVRSEPPTHRLGRTLSTGLDGVAIVGLLAVDTLMIVELFGMLQTFFYFDTPRWALMTPFIALVVWTVTRPQANPWRVISLWVPAILVLGLGILLLSFTTVQFGRLLLPSTMVSVIPVIQAFKVLAYVGLPVGVTLRRMRTLLAEPPTWTWRIAALALPVLFLSFIYVITIGSIGPAALVAVRWPVVFVLDHVTLDSTFFLSRIGIVVILLWTVGEMLGLVVHLRLASRLVEDCWLRGSGWIPVLVGSAWWISAMSLSSAQSANVLLIRWINPGIAVYLIVEVVILGALRVLA